MRLAWPYKHIKDLQKIISRLNWRNNLKMIFRWPWSLGERQCCVKNFEAPDWGLRGASKKIKLKIIIIIIIIITLFLFYLNLKKKKHYLWRVEFSKEESIVLIHVQNFYLSHLYKTLDLDSASKIMYV